MSLEDSGNLDQLQRAYEQQIENRNTLRELY